jgi:short subunit dehydrogenase-like uncharacterized protein
MATGRPYDVVLFGATGFTGGLTAEYLARHVPAGTRWALAGRNREKLDALRRRLTPTERSPEHATGDIALLTADINDPGSLRELAASARVVITTVGPYIDYGEPLVAACADAGTDYVDLCGEPEFVDRMYLRHHDRARRSGARLVHACGFDSIPYDLGVLLTVNELPEGVPLTVEGHIRASATFSGGTYSSALTAFSRHGAMLRAARQRRRAEPRPAGRRVHLPAGPPRRDRDTGRWLVPLPTIDPRIVGSSAAALSRYGPDFTYRHYAAVEHLPVALAGVAGAGVLFAAAQVPPLRRALAGVRGPGAGPSEQRRANSWFTVRLVGAGGGRRVVSEVAGGDPGYGETAKMLAESALCLAFDDLPATSGQVTPAAAIGVPLIERLRTAGLTFRVVESGASR